MDTNAPQNLWTLGKVAEAFRISYARLAMIALQHGIQPRWTLNGLAYYQDDEVAELRKFAADDAVECGPEDACQANNTSLPHTGEPVVSAANDRSSHQ